ncbi:MAG: hypothetical protein ACD_45C00716G0003 [uncultured bacterium]|nr:MAG: hypothetical protein ACD_45C00716G0003 [uncultured bacterium]
MRTIKWFISLLILLPTISTASIPCKTLPSISKGFNFIHYQQCYRLLHRCPTQPNNPLLDETCVTNIIKKNQFCTQLRDLSRLLETDPDYITVHMYTRKFAIMSVLSPADGDETYYILTPQNCVMQTIIDPQNLDVSLKKRYKNKKSYFYTQSNGKPKLQINANGNITIRVPIKVTKECRACSTLLEGMIQYNFTKEGTLIKASVQNIKEYF